MSLSFVSSKIIEKSRRSPLINRKFLLFRAIWRFPKEPLNILSRPITSAPNSNHLSARLLPMNPATPVIKTFLSLSVKLVPFPFANLIIESYLYEIKNLSLLFNFMIILKHSI